MKEMKEMKKNNSWVEWKREKKKDMYIQKKSCKFMFTADQWKYILHIFFSKGRPLSYILKDNRYQES